MLKLIYKKIFWSNYDFVLPNIAVSLFWFILNFPFFFLLFSLIMTKNFNPNYYIPLMNIILFGPFSAAAVYATSFMINSDPKGRKISLFFTGLKKFWPRSLLFSLLTAVISLLFYNAFVFYAGARLHFPAVVQFIFAGLILWISFFFIFMQINFLPILVNQNEKIYKVFYKSFLLVLDNLGSYFLLGLFLLSTSILFLFSILGFILLFGGYYFLSLNIITMSLLSKYNKNIIIEKETRTFKNLIKPWE